MSVSKLTICIPSYNEAENIDGLASQIIYLARAFDEALDFIILNNGSRDDTLQKLENAVGSAKFVKIIDSKENLGYGGGMKALIDAATTDYVCLLPADLQYSNEDIEAAINVFLDDYLVEERKFVIGERSKRSDAKSQIFTSKVYSLLVRTLWNTPKLQITKR